MKKNKEAKEAVWMAVNRAVGAGVHVDEAVFYAVDREVWRAVYRAVGNPVTWAVYRAVQETADREGSR